MSKTLQMFGKSSKNIKHKLNNPHRRDNVNTQKLWDSQKRCLKVQLTYNCFFFLALHKDNPLPKAQSPEEKTTGLGRLKLRPTCFNNMLKLGERLPVPLACRLQAASRWIMFSVCPRGSTVQARPQTSRTFRTDRRSFSVLRYQIYFPDWWKSYSLSRM